MVTPSSSQPDGSATVAQPEATMKKTKKKGKAKRKFTCIRFAHGCPNTVTKHKIMRLHPGPDGSQTLCSPCNISYKKRLLPVFADANYNDTGKVSAVPFPGSLPAVIIAFAYSAGTIVPIVRIDAIAISHAQHLGHAPDGGAPASVPGQPTALGNAQTLARNRVDSDKPVQSSAPVKEEDQLVMLAEEDGARRTDIAMSERHCGTGATAYAPQSIGVPGVGVEKGGKAFTQQITTCASTLPLESNIAAQSSSPGVQSFCGHDMKTRAETAIREVGSTLLAASATERAHGSVEIVGEGKTPADHQVAANTAKVNPERGSSSRWIDEPIVRNTGVSGIRGATNECNAEERRTWSRDQLSSSGDGDIVMPVAGARARDRCESTRHASPELQRDPATPLISTDCGRDVPNVTTPATQNSESSRLSVKASAGANKPARRFTIERGLSYQALVDKMRDMFDLKAGCFISYKDNEGDKVAVASNNELDEMIHVAWKYSICPIRLQVTGTNQWR